MTYLHQWVQCDRPWWIESNLLSIVVLRPFRRKKEGLWIGLRPSVHASMRLVCNSATTGLIHSKSSSLELSLDVQSTIVSRCTTSWSLVLWGHMGMPMGIIRTPEICNKGFWNLADARTQQPLGRLTWNQVHWNHLSLSMCNIMVICPLGHNGCVHGCDKGSWNIADAGTLQLLGLFTPNQVLWNRLGL